MIETTAQLTPDPNNPRQITVEQKEKLKKSLEAYGDLSGIVYNRRTRLLVGGHQRTSLFGPDCKIEAKYFDKPDKQGTIGMGHIILLDGSKHHYREVDWPKEFAAAANIAANAHGGEWEEKALRDMLVLISEGEGEAAVDPETLGLTNDFMAALFKAEDLKLNVQEQEKKALVHPLTQGEIDRLPSQTAMVQLFFTIATRPKFIENVRKLQITYGTANLTETIDRAVHNSLGLHAASKAEVFPEACGKRRE